MKVTVLGTGAYGLALSKILLENGHDVTVWTKIKEEKEQLDSQKFSPKLPEFIIPMDLKVSTDLECAVNGSKLIIIAIPAQFVDSVAQELSEYYNDQFICIATKGIEQESCVFINEVVERYIKTKKIAVISGPSFAVDIINDIPIGLSLGSMDWDTIHCIEEALENDHFKLRETKDIIGIEICGAVKNVLAIASGMIEGMGLPISTQAMFITEALNDVKSLISDLNGDPKTILSFAGFGDILLTCTSSKSRNFSFGKLIGRGATKEEIENYKNNTTIEGLYTLKSIFKLVNDKNIDIPIIDMINDIVNGRKNPNELLNFLIIKK